MISHRTQFFIRKDVIINVFQHEMYVEKQIFFVNIHNNIAFS